MLNPNARSSRRIGIVRREFYAVKLSLAWSAITGIVLICLDSFYTIKVLPLERLILRSENKTER